MPAGVTYEIDDNAAKCIRAYSSTSWKDASCTDTHGYFCEFTETTTTTSTSTTTTTPTTTSTAAVTPCPYGCQPGYSDWQSVGSCYKYIASSNIQTLAALACGLDLAALLVVDSAAEQLAVQSSISDSVWMGITYSGSSWQKPLLGGALSYTNWNSPAPASSLSTAYIDSTNSYKWSVGSVLTTAETVCEAKCLLAPLPGACNLNPCVNGNCTNGKLLGLFTCTCSAGYTGTVCNTEIDECDSSPCLNNGVCTDTFNGYNCTCLAAFSGTNCEVKLTTCDLQTSSEQKQRIAMFASQSVSSIVLLVALGILVIIFLILLDFSLERVFHMGQEISLWLAHITILFARTRTVLDAGAFCGADASGNPPKLSNVQCGLVAVWLHYLYLVHFAFLFMETLHNYTLYTYVFVLQPLLKRKFVLLLGLLGPLPIVALTAGIWFSDYVTEQTCWLNFSSVNFFFELLPALIMCAAGEICAEATGMVEYARNVMAKEEKRFSANTNSKGSILIVPPYQ
uniref:Uncharacterized protein n=1 Tax=Plectus sambesii TaxID=2011161 RepID=A0A914VZ39_9BILA